MLLTTKNGEVGTWLSAVEQQNFEHDVQHSSVLNMLLYSFSQCYNDNFFHLIVICSLLNQTFPQRKLINDTIEFILGF